ncbi:MAG: hypothetical protein AB1428_10570 [Bacteroidota bacterium]
MKESWEMAGGERKIEIEIEIKIEIKVEGKVKGKVKDEGEMVERMGADLISGRRRL